MNRNSTLNYACMNNIVENMDNNVNLINQNSPTIKSNTETTNEIKTSICNPDAKQSKADQNNQELNSNSNFNLLQGENAKAVTAGESDQQKSLCEASHRKDGEYQSSIQETVYFRADSKETHADQLTEPIPSVEVKEEQVDEEVHQGIEHDVTLQVKEEVKDELDFYDENNIIDHEICIKNELDDSDIQPFYFAL